MNEKITWEDITSILGKDSIKYNELMSKHTTMKVGGKAKVFVEPRNTEEVMKVVEYAKANNIKYYIVGNGSNLLVSDEGYDGIIIKIGQNFSDFEFLEETVIKVAAGLPLIKLAYMAKDNSLTGLEFASGIPGTIGGAIRMNAGAYGGEMVNVVEKVGVLDTNTGKVFEIYNEEAEFSYRHSIFAEKTEYIIVYAVVKLEKGNKEEIEVKMNENNTSRKEKQPIEFPSSGSTFKRGDGYISAKLIDDAGLKGYKIGGAEVSTKHAGFVINSGNATCKDVVDLIEYIKNTIYEKFNIMLQEEVVILGGK